MTRNVKMEQDAEKWNLNRSELQLSNELDE
jgi:hypothetical protein